MPGEVIVSMDYRGELPCLIGCICLILNVENTRVMTHTLMGFYRYNTIERCGVSVKPPATLVVVDHLSFFFVETTRRSKWLV